MFQTKLLRTTIFRAALLYLSIFLLSTSMLYAYLFWNSITLTSGQTDAAIEADIADLSKRFKEGGIPSLARRVAVLSRDPRLSIYLLIDPQGLPMAGNLNKVPDLKDAGEGWKEFEFVRITNNFEEKHAARAKTFTLPQGFYLLVGRDVEEFHKFSEVIFNSMVYGLGMTVLFGLVGGVIVSRNFTRRIDSINRPSSDIMAGDLSRRIPVRGSGDEIDQLGINLNKMLSRIESLMNGMRDVTDNIAHDLRSPINRVRNKLEVTLMKPASPEDYKKIIQETIAEADELLAVFNALLSVAQLEAGARDIQKEMLDIVDLTKQAVEFMEPVGEEIGARFDLDLPEAPLLMKVAHPLMSQALINLIDNAIKYGSSNETVISVGLTKSKNTLIIYVADNGPGIPPSDMSRVTERFVRLDASRNRPGSGLGLSLVSAIARSHGGELRLKQNLPQGLKAEIVLTLDA
ncbi:MAG: HAMP domain-containing protein [Alphaproteobacteria bacterium]|nr:HAMP domain-containing protein [Alphaproteobacteria bacterium]